MGIIRSGQYHWPAKAVEETKTDLAMNYEGSNVQSLSLSLTLVHWHAQNCTTWQELMEMEASMTSSA